MKTIIFCKINIGTLFQDLYLKTIDSDGKSTTTVHTIPIGSISNFIAEHNEVSQVFLNGNKVFLQQIEKEVITKYNITNKKFHYI